MGSKFEDFAGGLTDLPNIDSIWESTAEFVHNLGFSGCSLVLGKKAPFGVRSPRILSNFSEAFTTAYEKEGLGEIDPFLLFSCNDMTAKKIVTKDLSSFPKASEMHKLFLDHAAENGAVGSLGIPVRTNSDETFGGWILSNSDSEDQFDLLHQDHGKEAHLAAVLAYERMIALGYCREANGDLLSGRERECLLWLCAGLRVTMIANKLNISESAVNQYVGTAKRKLGARTREQAVARAIFSGEINL